MKLYVMQCGVLYSEKGVFVKGCDGIKFDVPVPYFLIQHEKGYVLFDSGHNKNTITNTKSLNSVILDSFCPAEFGDGFVLESLKNLGVSPEEIVYHVCSHLHFDHAGGVGLFPNATYVVQEEELLFANSPPPAMEAVYFREDFDKEVKWLKLRGNKDNKYDLFGDGKLIIYYTPGHTPGTQSLLVNLEKSPPVLLAQDACFTEENLNEQKLPGAVNNGEQYMETLKIFKKMQDNGVKIITGHDPIPWQGLKKSPEFYA
ncbi:MAG: N-acyl homoserine lactonase family protein [Defluviitaleaceae bacterium]|nr:N-acyl homoserine lactonase family protein [Defluviitaleaceae bacterium]